MSARVGFFNLAHSVYAHACLYTRAIPKDILDNNIFHNLYISEMYIVY